MSNPNFSLEGSGLTLEKNVVTARMRVRASDDIMALSNVVLVSSALGTEFGNPIILTQGVSFDKFKLVKKPLLGGNKWSIVTTEGISFKAGDFIEVEFTRVSPPRVISHEVTLDPNGVIGGTVSKTYYLKIEPIPCPPRRCC